MALERRFQIVIVDEPTEEDAISILRGIKDKYEVHHGVRIQDDAVISAVELSSRYISDRFLPDKAIDVMDEAGSRARIAAMVRPPDLKHIEEEINNIQIQKKDAIENQSFEEAANLRDKEKSLKNFISVNDPKFCLSASLEAPNL